ncbi:MAG: hypothetical protein ACTHOB_02955 [Ginsengibacter sp.]
MNKEASKTKPFSKTLLLTQLLEENETWKRALEFLTDEDVKLKTRLSHLLKNLTEPEKNTLDTIEYLYSRLLKENETLGTMRARVSDNEKQLSCNFTGSDCFELIQDKQNKLRKDMEAAELKFHKLKFDFNKYISELIQTSE